MLPLVNRLIPLICDDWAKPELGSGCVKITPAHDPNDYEVGLRHKLAMVNVMTEDGKVARVIEPDGTVNPNSSKYEGLRFATKGREKVVADMEAAGLIERIEDRLIDIGHSDRSKTQIEPFLSDQWFVKMGDLPPEQAAKIEGLRGASGLNQLAIDAVKRGEVRFFPARYESAYVDWLTEKRDWCISRQLWWGHRIPVWSYSFCLTPETWDREMLAGGLDHLLEGTHGYQVSDHDFAVQVIRAGSQTVLADYSELLQPPAKGTRSEYVVRVCHIGTDDRVRLGLEKAGFVQDPDVLDTWFSSALWPHSTLGWPDADPNDPKTDLGCWYPTNVLITAREIITLWVARMVMTGLYNVGKKPFTDVVIHSVIQDGQGRKMSKTLGNGVDPQDIIDEYGADALRITLADLATETQDIRLPVKPKKLPDGRKINISEKFEKGRNFCNKLWQASTGFVMRNLEGYAPAPLDPGKLGLEDRWILSRMTACLEKLNQAFERYQFSAAASALYGFMWDEYCSWYIEMSKPRLAGPGKDATQQVMVHVLDQLLRMLHPLVPFVTEAIWAELKAVAPRRGLRAVEPVEEAVVIAAWPKFDAALRDESTESQMDVLQGLIRSVRDIRTVVNDYRGKAKLPSMRTLPTAIVRADAETCRLVDDHGGMVKLLAGCDALEAGPDKARPHGTMSRLFGSVQVFIPVAELIDLSAVRRAEEAKLGEMKQAIERAQKQLSNASFVERADPEVVAATRQRAEDLSSQIRLIEQHLADLE
jgi:valyl-tRNA synthetase